MGALGGFTLGVFAPRKGKTAGCKSAYTKLSAASTLQNCFLECASDNQCENVFVHGVLPTYTEAPAPISCTLLGLVELSQCAAAKCDPITNPADCGTLVHRLPHGRSCAYLWETPTTPAIGVPPMSASPLCHAN